MNLNLFLFDLVNRLYDAAAERLPLPCADLYQRYQTIRSTFTTNMLPNWAAWAVTGAILVFFVLLLLVSSRSNRTASSPMPIAHPQKLFEEILQSLDLTGEEKNLLHEMTDGARLQHPSMCLLSPYLLDSARAVWRNEKGDASISPLKLQQIDTICCKLYDHLPPSSMAEHRRFGEINLV